MSVAPSYTQILGCGGKLGDGGCFFFFFFFFGGEVDVLKSEKRGWTAGVPIHPLRDEYNVLTTTMKMMTMTTTRVNR